ncbi:TraB/GumN family protein [Alteraurantiacibacter buctensis]|uniref:TraB/GumN family protein n=1 Tax=Alteraurantiacibacter buctensis TaxID=1503981 RepID=A0A844YZM8_9SPHN|nr:TraB/GumN family protein [Alteraurantiacibacter buctensis]MXO72221.1 TraB/GumN family protein [Alteraurantiacibacter buctensis]
MPISMVRKAALALAGACLLPLLGSCATPADAGATTEQRPADAVPGPALWVVRDEDTTIYLFGTVHVLPEGVEWFDTRIAGALSSADELVTELNMDNPEAISGSIIAAAPLPEGQNLRELMTPQNRVEFETALTSIGLPPNALDRYEPWYAAIVLSLGPLQNAGFDPATGVENALAERAAGKRHDALETIEQQVQMFDGMELEHQLNYVDEAAEGVADVLTTVETMVSQWRAGDVDQLGQTLNDDMDDAYLVNRLLINRNMNWAGWIERRLAQPGRVFVAVGAGHLAGEGSVQDQLRTRGLTVTRIWK